MPAPITTSPIFTAEDLTDLVDDDVSEAQAKIVEAVVWGWLGPRLNLAERPPQVTEQLFGWAIELGAIFSENPNGLTAYQLGEERSQYSSERRDAILQEAENSTVDGQTAAGSPRGSFPPVQPWPYNFFGGG